MAKTNIVMVRMPDNVRSDVKVIQEYLQGLTRQSVTTSDAIRTAIATMAAEIQQDKQQKESDNE